MKIFTIKESLVYGWGKFKENAELSILTTLFVLALGFASPEQMRDYGILGLLSTILIGVLLIIVEIGYRKIFLRMNDGEKPKFKDIFSEYKLFWKYIGLSILVGLVTFIGFILLIIPGIIFALRYSFATFILVDTRSGIRAAMKESGNITKGSKWKLLGFWIVIGILNIVGIMAFGIGLLISIPVTAFASVYVYRALSRAKAAIVEELPAA